MSRAKKKDHAPDGAIVVARNRRATRDYDIESHLEVGIVLTGSEVKSMRQGGVDVAEAYGQVIRGELWLIGARISPYANASRFNHEPERRRKLLAHRREIMRLTGKIREKGLTLIPLLVYFLNGRAKLGLALAKGKPQHGRKLELADRERKRQLRAVRRSHDADV